MKLDYLLEIRSSPAAVFSWLDRPERAKQWMQGVTKTEILRETPDRIGTTFRERMEEDGRGLDMTGEITGYVPDQFISFRLDSRIHCVKVEYRVGRAPDGARLSVRSSVEWKFPMSAVMFLMGNKVKTGLLRTLAAECAELKRLCEAG